VLKAEMAGLLVVEVQVAVVELPQVVLVVQVVLVR
jgi:hypothetical protein